MTRKPRIVTSLFVACGLTVAVAASAQHAEHRVEVFTQAIPGPSGAAHAMPSPGGAGPNIMIHAPGPHGMPGGVAGHGPDIQAALSGPAGALSTPDMLLRHAKQLELTGEQVEALRGLQIVMRKAHVKAEAETQLAHIDVEALADSAAPDLAALEEAFLVASKAQVVVQMLGFRLSREARSELSDGQLAKWDELLRQRHDAAAMHAAHASMMPGGMAPGALHMPHGDMSHDDDGENHWDNDEDEGDHHDDGDNDDHHEGDDD
ncbi:hypothetical protein HN371_03145 [Candidatus Poribacteria bacterium]|jgi:hypothetical protein|nr:hypothetical protein [Candidatus Poribacteria bacterium]MBT5532795.1 hypothetical protein [Candidatus Poribacteria bacterium]MBT5714202.1 hypothetical protein [Candidatus Poribacteria bacterium]MBT7097295.1 hypothetical protein [Candidatus Poribacteria bacterium]MBT7809432.1 hypothetical protein [Candidatus Poribacteria bacterium]